MKMLSGLLLLLGLVACKNHQEPAPANRPRIVSDSNMVKTDVSNPYVAVDVSPMDMSYLPNDYPKMADRSRAPVARVIYSRPHKQGRKIFGSLLKYGEPWRLGANEATELELFIPVRIMGKQVPKGKYVLYCIPEPDHWTIILNSNLNSWGLTPDPSKDLYHFDVPATVKDQSVEFFSMVFQNTSAGADLVMAWDDVEARLPIQMIP